MEVFEVETYKESVMISITKQVREAVARSGINEGVVLVYTPHTTAGITISENADPDVVRDMLAVFGKILPDVSFKHSEGNSPAHFKSILAGVSVSIPVTDGKPALGLWQDVYFCEFDGPRQRKIYVQVVKAG